MNRFASDIPFQIYYNGRMLRQLKLILYRERVNAHTTSGQTIVDIDDFFYKNIERDFSKFGKQFWSEYFLKPQNKLDEDLVLVRGITTTRNEIIGSLQDGVSVAYSFDNEEKAKLIDCDFSEASFDWQDSTVKANGFEFPNVRIFDGPLIEKFNGWIVAQIAEDASAGVSEETRVGAPNTKRIYADRAVKSLVQAGILMVPIPTSTTDTISEVRNRISEIIEAEDGDEKNVAKNGVIRDSIIAINKKHERSPGRL